MRLLQIPIEKTADRFHGLSAHTLCSIQQKRRRVFIENSMSTAKRQKESHILKTEVERQAQNVEQRERRRALRIIDNIGNAAEQDAQSTDSEDKEIIEDIKNINTEIYNLKL